MLLSLGLILICGMTLGSIFQRLKLPKLVGMLLAGIFLGPYVLNLLDSSILNISTELRQIALVIILTRAGLNLNFADLKKVGRPAILMCFIPACFEIVGMLILAPILFNVTLLEAAIMGTVVAAVSPAVIVPRMLKLMENGYGRGKGIPQMIMTGASVDDVFVIVLFTAFMGLEKGDNVTPLHLISIPTSIIFGLIAGLIVGLLLVKVFTSIRIGDSEKVIIILAIAFLFVTLEHKITGVIGFSGLLGVMAIGATLYYKNREISKVLSHKFSNLWVWGELLLFVLVGASLNIEYLFKAGFISVLLILLVLIFRVFGVFLCLVKTPLNGKERIFSAISYLPKATVQAAIGGLPLAMGLACGDTVLAVAVISILITAPIGALLIDMTYKKLLSKDDFAERK